MRKITEIASKTGLPAAELNKITRFGLLGVAALTLASLAACFKSNKAEPKPAQPAAREQTGNLRELADSVNVSTAPAKPRGRVGDNCGPYPGYPCGTRYYTVSVSDFKACR